MYSNDTVIGPLGSSPKENPEIQLQWPQEGLTTVPDWIYTHPQIYAREIERIFHGRSWNFVALEAEIPNVGDYKRSYVGATAPATRSRGSQL